MFAKITNKVTNLFTKPKEQKKDTGNKKNFITDHYYPSDNNSNKKYHNFSLSKEYLESLYRFNGIGKRIVDMVVEDATRNFIDCDVDLMDELKRLYVKQHVTDAGCFGRLFGGAIIVAFVEDYQDYSKPLNLKIINKINVLRVYDRHRITHTPLDICNDINSKFFNQPEYFTIDTGCIETGSIRVHRSRCFIFGGERSTDRVKDSNSIWDDSIINKGYDALCNYIHAQDSTIGVLEDFVQTIFKMNGLSDKFSSGDESELQTRVQFLNYAKKFGNSNILLLDAEAEDYEKKASSMGGYSDALDRLSECLCGIYGIPASRLFGRSPAGLNSTGESEMQHQYDGVRSFRTDSIEPFIDWLILIIGAQKNWKGKNSNLTWEFASLTSPTEMEQVEIKKKYAEIDIMYADRNAIDLREVYTERYKNGKFHHDIDIKVLNEDDAIDIDDENIDMIEAQYDEKKAKQKEEKLDGMINKIVEESYSKIKKGI